jgi:hypothetical protein
MRKRAKTGHYALHGEADPAREAGFAEVGIKSDPHGVRFGQDGRQSAECAPVPISYRVYDMLRPSSWSRPAGESPARVGTGAPDGKPRFVGEIRRAERGVESHFGESNNAVRSIKRTKKIIGKPCAGEPHAWSERGQRKRARKSTAPLTSNG